MNSLGQLTDKLMEARKESPVYRLEHIVILQDIQVQINGLREKQTPVNIDSKAIQ